MFQQLLRRPRCQAVSATCPSLGLRPYLGEGDLLHGLSWFCKIIARALYPGQNTGNGSLLVISLMLDCHWARCQVLFLTVGEIFTSQWPATARRDQGTQYWVRHQDCLAPLHRGDRMAPEDPAPDSHRNGAYALTSLAEAKDKIYDILAILIREIPQHEPIFLLGDSNARVGKDHSSCFTCLGQFGKRNGNGQRLLEFCCYHVLCITTPTSTPSSSTRYPGDTPLEPFHLGA